LALLGTADGSVVRCALVATCGRSQRQWQQGVSFWDAEEYLFQIHYEFTKTDTTPQLPLFGVNMASSSV
jgi:hypothetical protein